MDFYSTGLLTTLRIVDNRLSSMVKNLKRSGAFFQGSALGPLLFLIYINNIANISLSPGTKLVIHADDMLWYKPIRWASDNEKVYQLHTW